VQGVAYGYRVSQACRSQAAARQGIPNSGGTDLRKLGRFLALSRYTSRKLSSSARRYEVVSGGRWLRRPDLVS